MSTTDRCKTCGGTGKAPNLKDTSPLFDCVDCHGTGIAPEPATGQLCRRCSHPQNSHAERYFNCRENDCSCKAFQHGLPAAPEQTEASTPLKASDGKSLREGEHVTIGYQEYVVYRDTGSATGQAPYWRFKRVDSEVGLVPSGIKHYPYSVFRLPTAKAKVGDKVTWPDGTEAEVALVEDLPAPEPQLEGDSNVTQIKPKALINTDDLIWPQEDAIVKVALEPEYTLQQLANVKRLLAAAEQSGAEWLLEPWADIQTDIETYGPVRVDLRALKARLKALQGRAK